MEEKFPAGACDQSGKPACRQTGLLSGRLCDTGTYREVSCFPLVKGDNLPVCRVLFFINYKEKQLCNDICYAIRF